jgi:hypothetical protein
MHSAARLHAALALVALLCFEGTAAAGLATSTGVRSCCLCTVFLFLLCIACRLGDGPSTCAPPGRRLLGRFEPEPKPEPPPEPWPEPEPRPGPRPTSLVRPPWVPLGSEAPAQPGCVPDINGTYVDCSSVLDPPPISSLTSRSGLSPEPPCSGLRDSRDCAGNQDQPGGAAAGGTGMPAECQWLAALPAPAPAPAPAPSGAPAAGPSPDLGSLNPSRLAYAHAPRSAQAAVPAPAPSQGAAIPAPVLRQAAALRPHRAVFYDGGCQPWALGGGLPPQLIIFQPGRPAGPAGPAGSLVPGAAIGPAVVGALVLMVLGLLAWRCDARGWGTVLGHAPPPSARATSSSSGPFARLGIDILFHACMRACSASGRGEAVLGPHVAALRHCGTALPHRIAEARVCMQAQAGRAAWERGVTSHSSQGLTCSGCQV